MYSLGAFVRHIVRGFSADVGPTASRAEVVQSEVREQVRETRDGARVTLRRTTIDEVQIDPPSASSGGGPARV